MCKKKTHKKKNKELCSMKNIKAFCGTDSIWAWSCSSFERIASEITCNFLIHHIFFLFWCTYYETIIFWCRECVSVLTTLNNTVPPNSFLSLVYIVPSTTAILAPFLPLIAPFHSLSGCVLSAQNHWYSLIKTSET